VPGRPALLTITLLAGCQQVWGLERSIDAPLPPDAAPDAPADAANCYGTGLVTLCLVEAPSGNFDAPSTTEVMVDTDGPICQPYSGDDPGWCVVAAETMTIRGALRGRGSKPLVLVASNSISVTGAIDVSSDSLSGAGGDPLGCPGGIFGAVMNGGGAGGTFGGAGGHGGIGGISGNGGVPAQPTAVAGFRGGCHGGNGANVGPGGLGGGAVFVIAGSSITVTGVIDASGSGGRGGRGSNTLPGGGGGGGSGGMIGLDAPSITVIGSVFANGGGGGEGGGTPSDGDPGAKPAMALTPAPGGTIGTIPGGDGGDGAAGTGLTGMNGRAGMMSVGGGGGGGGGAGIVHVFPPRTLGPNVSPPPS